MHPDVTAFFDQQTSTLSYLVADPESGRAAIVDPVLDFDPKSGRTATTSADRIIQAVRERNLGIDWLLETHVHADHLSAAPYLKKVLGGRIGIGSGVTLVQRHFAPLFGLEADCSGCGAEFDRLLADDEIIGIGRLKGRVLATPGHTPACVSYLFGNAVFVGDALFMPDYGTARCDFPGGSPALLHRSIRRLLDLPPATRLFTAHDYQPQGRPLAYESTVAEQRANNIHIREGISAEQFISLRTERDRSLALPALMLPAVQVNIRAGAFPPALANGRRYLRIPVDSI